MLYVRDLSQFGSFRRHYAPLKPQQRIAGREFMLPEHIYCSEACKLGVVVQSPLAAVFDGCWAESAELNLLNAVAT